MLEPMKKQDIKNYTKLSFIVPKEKMGEIRRILKNYGAKELSNSIPWKQVYPNFNASVALKGARCKEGFTQKQLADKLGVKQNHISEMEHNKRPIGKEMAKRLSEVLNINYKVFL